MDQPSQQGGSRQGQESAQQAALEDGSWVEDIEFMMYKFKVDMCKSAADHDWDTCPFAHIGERTCRRRDPARCNYTSVICVDVMQKGRCPRGRSCPAAHTVFEYWLHPHRYRTEMCKVGGNCTRRICFFAHRAEELRPLPPHLHSVKVAGSATGKYSLSATRQAAQPAATGIGAGSAMGGTYTNYPQPLTALRQPAGFWGQPMPAGSMRHGLPVVPAVNNGNSSIAHSCGMPGVVGGMEVQQQPLFLPPGSMLLAREQWQPPPQQQQQRQQPHMSLQNGAQAFAAGSQLLAQLQQLGLAQDSSGLTMPVYSAAFAAAGLDAQITAVQSPPTARLAVSGRDVLVGQQQWTHDKPLNMWQQQSQPPQQSHFLPAPLHITPTSCSGQPNLTPAQQVYVLQPYQQLQQSVMVQLPCAHNKLAALAQALAAAQAAQDGTAGYQQEALQGAPVSPSAMSHTGQLAIAQGHWVL